MMTKDSYNDLRDRVEKFGNEYFNNKGEALLKEMEAFISNESNEFEKDIVDNVLKSNLYSETIKKEAEAILDDATRAKSDMADIHKMLKGFFPFEDTFVQDEETQPTWEKVATKQVLDSDGFWTEYTWYKDSNGHHVMIFGDTDLYTPETADADMETDNEKEAKEWFDNYKGFDDDSFNLLSIEDSATNDMFIQDDENLYDVIVFDEEKRKYLTLMKNVPEAKANEFIKKYKEEHPDSFIYSNPSKEQRDAYTNTDEYEKYADEIDSKLEEEITVENVFNDDLPNLERICEEVLPQDIEEYKWYSLMDYAEASRDVIVEELKQTSEYEALEEEAEADNRDYEAMVDYYWSHR